MSSKRRLNINFIEFPSGTLAPVQGLGCLLSHHAYKVHIYRNLEKLMYVAKSDGRKWRRKHLMGRHRTIRDPRVGRHDMHSPVRPFGDAEVQFH